jgi:hypothetical protein
MAMKNRLRRSDVDAQRRDASERLKNCGLKLIREEVK